MFVYDETSPSCLRWSKDRFGGKGRKVVSAGQVAGHLRTTGYWAINLATEGCKLAHNVVWELHNGDIPSGFEIDHENGDPSDNKISNLRLKTHAANCQNRGMYSNNTTGTTGVTYAVRRGVGCYSATWREDGKGRSKTFSISKYPNALELAIQYREAQIERLNSLGENYTERHKEIGK